MKKSSNIDVKVAEMNFAVEELVDALTSLPTTHFIATTTGEESTKAKAEGVEGSEHPSPIMEVLPLVKVVSLMVEIATRIGGVVNAVEELARLAEFKAAKDGKPKQNQPTDKLVSDHVNS